MPRKKKKPVARERTRVTMELDTESLEETRKLAQDRGVTYTDYIRGLIARDLDDTLFVPMPEELRSVIDSLAEAKYQEPHVFVRNLIVEHLQSVGEL